MKSNTTISQKKKKKKKRKVKRADIVNQGIYQDLFL